MQKITEIYFYDGGVFVKAIPGVSSTPSSLCAL